MKKLFICSLLLLAVIGCTQKKFNPTTDFVIANGQMPAVAKDNNDNVHIVYGSGDSILYIASSDHVTAFSKPVLIAVLPQLYSFAMRGPQIAATEKGLLVTACTQSGNIYTFYKEAATNWITGGKINDADTVAKEGLMALNADGNNAFAVWLDLRGNKRNKIYGAKSTDAGKTWLPNQMIYTSPDSTVCECCKPSVLIKGNRVLVMFRNWVNGNRDMYLIESKYGGSSFAAAQQLGNGNWKLNGCPMDGGGLSLSTNGNVQTVWRRESAIFSSIPGLPEKEIGEGRGCTIETINNQNVYAWVDKGNIILFAKGKKQLLGKGSLPVLKSLDNETMLCVWEQEKQIHAAVVKL